MDDSNGHKRIEKVKAIEFCIITKEAICFYFVICNRKWYKRFPFLPILNIKYVKWRLDTAYGASFKRPPIRVIVEDCMKFLLWRHKNKDG